MIFFKPRFGQQDPSLWVKALTVSTSSDLVKSSWLAEILSSIGEVLQGVSIK